MDALSFLRADHVQLGSLLESLRMSAESDTGGADSDRRRSLDRLIIAYCLHESVEESTFWPAVRRCGGEGSRLAEIAIAQETHLKELLDSLDRGTGRLPSSHRVVAELLDATRIHLSFEEQVVWPLLYRMTSEEERAELGRRLARAKQLSPTRPHPLIPSSSLAQNTLGKVVSVLDQLRDETTGRGDDRPPEEPLF